jgi:2-polyprenyl-3-methyl-5-hydroxy-6-metoxy-1,4-benzoquinol methylase
MNQTDDQSRWEPVKELMAGAADVTLGPMHAYHMANTPRRLLYTLSYYKFACKLIKPPGTNSKRVLDIGCGEGIGTWTLAAECGYAKGVDFDNDLIEIAKQNWTQQKLNADEDSEENTDRKVHIDFHCGDALTLTEQPFDAVVNFDVIEHIMPKHADAFVKGMADQLKPHGLAIVGTPNITSAQYASPVTNAGHVNLYDADRLHAQFAKYFTQVFMFAANDEVIHTGFLPMAHYLIAVGVRPKHAASN